MTAKEALEYFKRRKEQTELNDRVQQAEDLAIKALEKQIPKKPDFEGDGYDDKGSIIYDTWICPCCEERYEVYYDNYKHCPNCGQALDWGETE